MNDAPAQLRHELDQLADDVRPVDLLGGVLGRSQQIGRRRAATASAVAAGVVAVVLLATWQAVGGWRAAPAIPAGPSGSAASPGTPATPTSGTAAPTSPPATAAPVWLSLPGLSGLLFYQVQRTGGYVVIGQGRAYGIGPRGDQVTVSPDGTQIAYIDDTRTLCTVGTDGRDPHPITGNLAGAGFEPAWSPDSTRVIVAAHSDTSVGTPEIVDVRTKRVTALPKAPKGVHFHWSGDGRHLVYSNGAGRIGIADADGGNPRLVPILGDFGSPANHNRERAAGLYSVSPDASLIAVNRHTGDEPDGDIGRYLFANAVVDARTGTVVPAPVLGELSAVVFAADGSVLYRATVAGTTTLTEVNAAGQVVGSAAEPVSFADYNLLAYHP